MENPDVGPGTRDEPVDWERIARFLAGESPADEADEVRGWLAEDPARQALLSRLDGMMDLAAAPLPTDADVDAALRGVRARMDEAETPVTPLRPRAAPSMPRRGYGASPVLRIAAAVLLLIGGAFLAMRMTGGGEPGMQVFTTRTGERDSLQLSDGTRVLLGPDSRLVVAGGYGRGVREVELRGEAMFDVRHDAARPFAVRAGTGVVRDIGTAFTVQTGPDGDLRVVVTSGSVAIRAAAQTQAQETVLRQGDRAVLADGRVAAERAAATPEDLAWTRGELLFRDAPLDQVAADVHRWYGVELRADDPSVAGRRLTASFTGEPREQVLRVIALALGAELEVRGDTAVLSGAPR